jgi:hypothetical protein
MANDWPTGNDEDVTKTSSKESESKGKLFSDVEIKKMIDDAQNIAVEQPCFNCLILGTDGTGKSGIVMDYCSKQTKNSVFIDVDGGDTPLKNSFFKDKKNIIVINPLEVEMTAKDVIIDYPKTISKVKAIIKYVNDHSNEFSAIVLDGISTLLKYAEYTMRIDKNLTADGGVQLRYWINRAKTMTEIFEQMKLTPIDKFYIGHEDLILQGTKNPAIKDPAVKQKINQLIYQRIICKKTQSADGKLTTFTAIIDKSKYSLAKEGTETVFATVNNGKAVWDIKNLFDGLK